MSHHDQVLEAVRGKRLVFTVTTGRSGTKFLCRALALFRGIKSLHEPKPTFSSAFRIVRAAPEVAREFWLDHKLPTIARHREPVYAETSHLVCKGYLESLAELGLAPTLIELTRDPRQVALSLLRLGTIPGRTFKGVKYYLAPWDENFLPLPEPEVRRLEDYQLCYWYCLEMAQRARVYRERFEPLGWTVIPVELEELASPGGIETLGAQLDLEPLGAWGQRQASRLSKRRVNSRPDKKREVRIEAAELDAMEREVRRSSDSGS